VLVVISQSRELSRAPQDVLLRERILAMISKSILLLRHIFRSIPRGCLDALLLSEDGSKLLLLEGESRSGCRNRHSMEVDFSRKSDEEMGRSQGAETSMVVMLRSPDKVVG